MSSPVKYGQCNSCNGVSTNKIWTKWGIEAEIDVEVEVEVEVEAIRLAFHNWTISFYNFLTVDNLLSWSFYPRISFLISQFSDPFYQVIQKI